MKIQLLPLKIIKPYPGNPRKNKAAEVKVRGSIREFKFRQPIVVDSEMVIIAGHTRYHAAIDLGMKKVPVHVADDLTPAQAKAYRLADNRTAQESEWDDDLLSIELGDLDGEGFPMELTGFNEDELERILNGGKGDCEGEAGDDTIPEQFLVIVQCKNEKEQVELIKKLELEGVECRALTS